MKTRLLALGIVVSFAFLAACDAVAPERALAPAVDQDQAALFTSQGVLRCPAGKGGITFGLLGPSGGTLSLLGHEMRVPADAVSEPTFFVMEVPRGQEAEVRIRPFGQSGYQFDRPVELSLSFDQCVGPMTLGDIDLQVVYLRPDGEVEGRGGVTDRELRTVTTAIDHLSGYAVGSN